MPAITLADLSVLALRLTFPISGAWTATLELDADEAPAGAVDLSDGTNVYQGFIVRAGVVSGVCRADVIGGAGGLLQDVPARSFQDSSARAILTDLLGSVGENLDPASTAAVLGAQLPYWTRAGVRASTALSSLCDALGARWRVSPSGQIWVGTETWPAAPESALPFELDRDDAAGTVFVAPDDLGLVPGIVLEGRRVGRVEYSLERDGGLRADYWVETS